MSRIFDRELECGCLISSDGGGAVSSCCYVGYGATKKEVDECKKAWDDWKKTLDYEKWNQEIKLKNG